MRSSLPFDDPRMPRFGAVGMLNTALGYAVILAGLALGLGDIISNATGYAAGLVLGFFLNRQWTFSRADGFRPGAVSACFVFVGGAGAPYSSTGVNAKWPGAAI